MGSLMYNLGAFFGEIAKTARTDVKGPVVVRAHETRGAVETSLGPGEATVRVREEVEVSGGVVTARRVTTEEVRVEARA